jgi:serine/threonine-protein kinase
VALTAEIEKPRRIGRYLLYGPIASGGMATVHFGAVLGEAGFSRTVAIKRVRADRRSTSLLEGLIDEARLVSRVQHPNVAATLDVVSNDGELLMVLDYIVGESLSRLLKRCKDLGQPVPVRHATSIMAGVLHGLNAAHDAKTARGKPLGIVHRDVSPQNILVGSDGLARVVDFGIATASERLSRTHEGQVKGKLAYIAPEQLRGKADRRTDIYAAAVVLWEMLAGRRLFGGKTTGDVMELILGLAVPPPSSVTSGIPAELDAVVLQGLQRDPERRFSSARHFALALEESVGIATASQIGSWVQELAGDALSSRAEQVAMLERHAAAHVGFEPVTGVQSSTPSTTPRPIERPGGAEPQTCDLPGTQDSDDCARTIEDPASLSEDVSTVSVKGVRTAEAAAPEPRQRTAASAVSGSTMPAVTEAQRRREPAAPEAEAPPADPLEEPRAEEVSVAPAEAAVPPRRGALLFVAVAAVVAAGVGVAWATRAPSSPAPATAEPAHGTAEPAQAPLRPPAPPPPLPPPAIDPAPTAAPSEQAPAPAPSSPPAPRPRASAVPPAPAPPPPPPTPVRAGCDPPYTLDERGIRRLKPECM